MKNALIVAGVVVGGYLVWRWMQPPGSPGLLGCSSCSGACVECGQGAQMTHAGALATEYGQTLIRGVLAATASAASSPGAFTGDAPSPVSQRTIDRNTLIAQNAPQPAAPAPTTSSTTTLGTAPPSGTYARQVPTGFFRGVR